MADAIRMYEWAAAGGYAPAAEAVARLANAPPAAESGWNEAERAALHDAMSALSGIARRYAGGLPPDLSDPLSIVATVGADPAALLDWIATNTRLVAYAGSLRGARGVLSDRSGNSLDRALAFAALLAGAGEEVRLARAVLTDGQAEALLAVVEQRSLLPAAGLLDDGDIRALLEAERSRLPADAFAAAVAAQDERQQRLIAARTDNTDIVLPVLMTAAESVLADGRADTRRASIQALKDHFWIQMRSGAGWTDLDPEQAVVGPIVAADTFPVDELPDALRHSVTIRVVVEIQSASGIREETLLSWTGFVADLGSVVASFWHASNTREGAGEVAAAGGDPTIVQNLVEGTSTWTPMLQVGDTVYVDRLFTRDGAVRTSDPNTYTEAGRAIAAGLAAAAGLIGIDAMPEAERGIPTAEWLEFEVSVPGSAAVVERRTVFDMLGPAQRADREAVAPTEDQFRDRALRLAGATDILILGATPSAVDFAQTATAGVAAMADAIRVATATPEVPSVGAIRESPRLALDLRLFSRVRFDGQGVAISSPNVFAHHQRLIWSPGGGVVAEEEVDIIFNDVWMPGDTFAGRIRQGVLDTNVEAIFGLSGAQNAATATLAAIRAGEVWLAVDADRAGASGGLPPDLRTRIESDRALGYLVVAPEQSVDAFGWWRIDPTTGRTLGMLATGGGAVLAPEALLTYQRIAGGVCLFALGVQIGMVVVGENVSSKFGTFVCAVSGGLGLAGAAGVGTGGVVVAGSGYHAAVSAIAALGSLAINKLSQ
ncbi:MAG: hypothetical protein AB7O56_02460 [Bauldia sp.]